MPWLSRKFLVTLAGLAAGVTLSYTGKLDSVSAALIGTLVSAYLGSNVTQKVVL